MIVALANYMIGIMHDLLGSAPCKVVLEDLDFQQLLELRLAMEKLSVAEMAVLEEILYSPLKVSLEELGENTDTPLEEMNAIILALAPLNLFVCSGNTLLVDKERRRIFEIFVEKFLDGFEPGLEYFKEILKLAPIHSTVAWFHISRTSNNIFNSIVDKHFKSPKMYQRYIKETLMENSLCKDMYQMVEQAEGKILAKTLKEQFSLSDEELEEKILFLEFHYLLTSCYEEKNGKYEKYVTQFSEWRKHQKHCGNSFSTSTLSEKEVECFAAEEFSFIKDMSLLLELCEKEELKIKYNQKQELFFLERAMDPPKGFSCTTPFYLARVINKNLLLGLIVIEEDALRQTSPAKKWLETPIKQRTMITFKHPHNSLSHKSDFSFGRHDRNIIEVQKALSRVKRDTWILFEEFVNDHLYTANLLKQPELTKVGRDWEYSLPDYDKQEISFIKTVVLDWLFESGMIIPGKYAGKECFRVTSLGYELYS